MKRNKINKKKLDTNRKKINGSYNIPCVNVHFYSSRLVTKLLDSVFNKNAEKLVELAKFN